MDDDTMSLEVWQGDWDLPSVDCDCLAVLAYCHFSGVPVKVKKTNNPWRSPTGRLPVMRDGDVTETKVANIFTLLRKQKLGCDFNLSNKQSADVVAFISMMEEKLLPALLHTWWIDSQAYVDITRPWYAKASPFPLNFFVPGRWQKWANQRVYVAKGSENITETDIETKIYKDAKECLNNLSQKLGKNEYFFGNSAKIIQPVPGHWIYRQTLYHIAVIGGFYHKAVDVYFEYIDPVTFTPSNLKFVPESRELRPREIFVHRIVIGPSSLDAVVFGYVAPLLKAPLLSNQLIAHLKQCDNLSLHCSRILRLYFPLSEEEMERKRKVEEKKQKETDSNQEFPNRKRNMVLAGVFACTSMITYAFLSGLISIEVIDQDPLKVDPH